MNETKAANWYEDRFRAVFGEEENFLDFLWGMVNRSRWDRIKTKDIRVMAMPESGRVADLVKAQYAKEGLDEEIVEDTARSTGLVLKVKKHYYPVRDCAIRSILDRAGISGTALKRVDRNAYARILNECLKVASGNALLRVSEGKVSAVLGGDNHDYAVLDMEQIFRMTTEYLHDHFKGCRYLGGFYEHDMVSCLWELTGESSLLDAYRRELLLHGRRPEEMIPVVRVTTSDTGRSGANIYPMLLHGSGKESIALGNALRLEHKAGATIGQYAEQLKMLYGKYQVAVEGLTKLLDTPIEHPVNCMQAVMKKLGIPKKWGMEALELFEAQYGDDPCTAHDIYYGISEVLYMLECEGEEGSRITAMEETIARAFSLSWQEYDLPGSFVW